MLRFDGLKRISVNSGEPVTLATAKAHLRVSSSTEDGLIGSYIKAAREFCEIYCHRSFVACQWNLSLSEFPSGHLSLPMGPVSNITDFYYHDDAGNRLNVEGCHTDLNGRIALLGRPDQGWPFVTDRPGRIIVNFTAGPADVLTDNPATLTSAMLLLIEHFYSNRCAVMTGGGVSLPYGVESLLNGLKIGGVV